MRHVTHVQDPRDNMHVSTSYHQHCSHNYMTVTVVPRLLLDPSPYSPD